MLLCPKHLATRLILQIAVQAYHLKYRTVFTCIKVLAINA